MTTLELTLDVPDRLAREARAAGLLKPRPLARMLAAEVRRAAAARLLAAGRHAARAGGRPLSMRAIQAEVNAVRRARKSPPASR